MNYSVAGPYWDNALCIYFGLKLKCDTWSNDLQR